MASASVSSPPVVRRNYLVDRAFQLKYAALLAVIGASLSAAFGVLMIVIEMESFRPLHGTLSAEGLAALRRVELTQLGMTAVTSILMAVSLGLLGILVTHRVAGPIYVLGRYVSVLARGRYPMMRPLRKRDELKGFFERFREAVESLRARDEEEARELDTVLERVAALASREPEIEALDRLRALRDRKRDVTGR